jgi:hypothetical protein
VDDALRRRCEEAMHVIDESGRVYRGADAYVFLQRAFKRPFSGLLPFFKWLVVFAYWLVSNNRSFFARLLYTKEKWA